MTFTDPTSVDKVLAQAVHELDGKKVITTISVINHMPITNLTTSYGQGVDVFLIIAKS